MSNNDGLARMVDVIAGQPTKVDLKTSKVSIFHFLINIDPEEVVCTETPSVSRNTHIRFQFTKTDGTGATNPAAFDFSQFCTRTA